MEDHIIVLRETRLDPSFPLSRSELIHLIYLILETLGLDDSSLEIKLVNDATISHLNQTFMGCEGPTNILSFPAQDEAAESDSDSIASRGDAEIEMKTLEDQNYLGELALSVDTLSRESILYGQSPVLHLVRLLAHGILHLVGHDHGPLMYDLTEMAVTHVETCWFD